METYTEIVKKGIAAKSTFAEIIAELEADGAFVDMKEYFVGEYLWREDDWNCTQNYYSTLDTAIAAMFSCEKWLENADMLDEIVTNDTPVTVDRIFTKGIHAWHANIGEGGDNGIWTTMAQVFIVEDWWEDVVDEEKDDEDEQ